MGGKLPFLLAGYACLCMLDCIYIHTYMFVDGLMQHDAEPVASLLVDVHPRCKEFWLVKSQGSHNSPKEVYVAPLHQGKTNNNIKSEPTTKANVSFTKPLIFSSFSHNSTCIYECNIY